MDWSHKQGKQSREKKLRENDCKDQGSLKLKLRWERLVVVHSVRGFRPRLTLRASLSWRANCQHGMFQRMYQIQSLTLRLATRLLADGIERRAASEVMKGADGPGRQAGHRVGEVSSDRTIKWNLLLQRLRRYWILPSYPPFLWVGKHTLGQWQNEGSQWGLLSPGHCEWSQFFWPLQKRGDWRNSKECFII